jgi:hypothetical protein
LREIALKNWDSPLLLPPQVYTTSPWGEGACIVELLTGDEGWLTIDSKNATEKRLLNLPRISESLVL